MYLKHAFTLNNIHHIPLSSAVCDGPHVFRGSEGGEQAAEREPRRGLPSMWRQGQRAGHPGVSVRLLQRLRSGSFHTRSLSASLDRILNEEFILYTRSQSLSIRLPPHRSRSTLDPSWCAARVEGAAGRGPSSSRHARCVEGRAKPRGNRAWWCRCRQVGSHIPKRDKYKNLQLLLLKLVVCKILTAVELVLSLISKSLNLNRLCLGFFFIAGVENGQTVRLAVGSKEILITFRVSIESWNAVKQCCKFIFFK